jgi:hypothetical protein
MSGNIKWLVSVMYFSLQVFISSAKIVAPITPNPNLAKFFFLCFIVICVVLVDLVIIVINQFKIPYLLWPLLLQFALAVFLCVLCLTFHHHDNQAH